MLKWSEMWPVALVPLCIIVGFVSIYPPLEYGSSLEILKLLVVTFLGAWAGGYAAFKAERKSRELDQRNSRLSAANKATFKIAQTYHVAENLRRFYIDREGGHP